MTGSWSVLHTFSPYAHLKAKSRAMGLSPEFIPTGGEGGVMIGENDEKERGRNQRRIIKKEREERGKRKRARGFACMGG